MIRSREIPFWVESRRRPGRFRMSQEACEVALALLRLESKRLADEAARWTKALSDIGNTVSPDARQAMEQANSCHARIEAIGRLIETVAENTYPADDVEAARRAAQQQLMRNAIRGKTNATG